MEKSHKDILTRLRKNIIDDIDVENDIIYPLRSEYILKEEDVRHIYIGTTREERAGNLLDILPRYVYLCAFFIIFAHILCKLSYFFILMLLHLLMTIAIISQPFL